MNRKLCVSISLLVFLCIQIKAQDYNFNLQEIIQRAKDQSPAAKQAETQRNNSYWQYRTFKSNYNPQVTLTGNAPGYSNQITGVQQPDGSVVYRTLNQTYSNAALGLQQPIAATGGNISVNTNLFQFHNFIPNPGDPATTWQSTLFNLQLQQPLFAFNPLRWDKKVQPIIYEQSKRSYVEDMEFVSRIAVDRYFGVLTAQINLQIAQFNLANNDTIYQIEQGRYNIGTTSEDKLLQVQLQLLRSRQEVAQAKLDFRNNVLRLRNYIGLNELSSSAEIELTLPEDIPIFEISEEDALRYAKQNRSQYISFERDRLIAEQAVARAKGQRYQVNMAASYGVNGTSSSLSDISANPNNQGIASIQFSVPIVSWGRNKSRLQTALANEQLTQYTIAQEELNFDQEIITQVRQFDMLQLQLEITKTAAEVAQKRYDVAQNRYLIGKIDITNLNIALTEKDTARRSYTDALQAYWRAYYDLRRLTLYDFENKTLLYNPELEQEVTEY
ncbi:TolC family protein [uncultured Imperialibacter sp.]|uniref:TolC family protein n=1 Tax=uncultured Imperialibacter sp. TaxID=1672639 RepID=UPI0030DD0F59|tara:strand:- start:16165 stop:17664 length:1500 start_codon:yes stop_codon:yes gene_type:complete